MHQDLSAVCWCSERFRVGDLQAQAAVSFIINAATHHNYQKNHHRDDDDDYDHRLMPRIIVTLSVKLKRSRNDGDM